jgi:hypothetical protein
VDSGKSGAGAANHCVFAGIDGQIFDGYVPRVRDRNNGLERQASKVRHKRRLEKNPANAFDGQAAERERLRDDELFRVKSRTYGYDVTGIGNLHRVSDCRVLSVRAGVPAFPTINVFP